MSQRRTRAPSPFGWTRLRSRRTPMRSLPLPPLFYLAPLAACVSALSGCSTSSLSNVPVAAAPPPKDDGKSAEGVGGGLTHSAALEQLKIAPFGFVVDKQASIRI